MRLKQLSVMILVIISLSALITFTGAVENIDYFNNTTEINFEGIDFTIPEGFGESKISEDYNDLGSEGKTCFYKNEAQGEIIITVVSDWMGMSLDELKEPGANKITLNNHKGWNYTKDNLHYFAYINDDKGVIVGVTNKTRLNEVII